MADAIERALAELARRLSHLEPNARQQILDESANHLEDLRVVHGGDAEAAVMQFGDPRIVGGALRREHLNAHTLLVAARSVARRLRKPALFLARLSAMGVAVAWAALWVTYWDAARGYDAELERAEALGLTVHYRDLDPEPAVPASENAGPYYRAAMEKAKTLGDTRKDDALIRTAAQGEPEDWVAVRKAVDTWSEVMPDVETAASKPRCHFTRDWSLGAALPFPEFGDLRRFADVLCVRALLEARGGDAEAAFRSLTTAANVARHAGEEPVLIGMLIQNGAEARVLSTVNRSVDILGPQSLSQARNCLESFRENPTLAKSLRGEVAFQFNAFREVDHLDNISVQSPAGYDDAATGSEGWILGRVPFAWLARPPLVNASLVERAYQARTLKRWNDAFEANGKDPSDPRRLSKALDMIGLEVALSRHPSDVLAKIVFPVFSHAGNAMLKLEAQKRMLSASFDLREQHAREGAYPETAKNLPLDPFDGKPLRYKREGKGFVLYSVGYDLKDNGGRERANMAAEEYEVDVLFKVPG